MGKKEKAHLVNTLSCQHSLEALFQVQGTEAPEESKCTKHSEIPFVLWEKSAKGERFFNVCGCAKGRKNIFLLLSYSLFIIVVFLQIAFYTLEKKVTEKLFFKHGLNSKKSFCCFIFGESFFALIYMSTQCDNIMAANMAENMAENNVLPFFETSMPRKSLLLLTFLLLFGDF